MGNFTILMDENKYLTISQRKNLYQGENYVDSFQIIVPQYYGDIDLRLFTVGLEYVDDYQNSHLDILVPDEELYKDNYIRYTLPVTTVITKRAGDIHAKLSMNYVDKEKLIQYTLHTSEVTFTIRPLSDYYKFSDESLNKVDKLIGQLDAKLDHIDSLVVNTPDDLGFDDNGTLHVTVGGKTLGNGVDVAVHSVTDTEDGSEDGILDLETIYKEVAL